MKPLFKVLLALSLISVTFSWSEEKPEEDFCDAEWDGKVEYKAEGEKDQPTPEEEEEAPETPATAEGGEEKEKEKDQKPEEDVTEPAGGESEQPEEGPASEETQPGKEPAGKEEKPGEKTPASSGSKEDDRGDRVNTYRKSAELVRDAANVDDIQDEEGYLKGSLNNRLQEHIRNPIIGAAGKLPHFKKIEPCFKTLKQDLKKEIDASKKEYADCKKKKESSYQCMVKMEPGFAAHVKAIGEKVVQCMEKSK